MTFVGFLFDIFAVAMLIEVFVEYFAYDVPPTGWASLMVVLLFSSGLILSMLGILGEYLWRTLDASRKRPPFIVEDVVESRDQESKKEA